MGFQTPAKRGQSRRQLRVGEQVRGELARLLIREATDPRLKLVVLTRVDVSPDLRNARVYWSRLQQNPRREARPQADPQTEAGLQSAAGFLRTRLSQLLPLRRTPELHFRFDPSIEMGARMLQQIARLQKPAEQNHGQK